MTEPGFAEQRRQFDEEMESAYRAIGRYVVDFSLLIAYMKTDIVGCLSDEDPDNQHLAWIALGEAPARQVSDSFFAMCSAITEYDDAEAKIVRKVQNEVNEEIARRNDFAHGDWFAALGPGQVVTDDPPGVLVLARRSLRASTIPGR